MPNPGPEFGENVSPKRGRGVIVAVEIARSWRDFDAFWLEPTSVVEGEVGVCSLGMLLFVRGGLGFLGDNRLLFGNGPFCPTCGCRTLLTAESFLSFPVVLEPVGVFAPCAVLDTGLCGNLEPSSDGRSNRATRSFTDDDRCFDDGDSTGGDLVELSADSPLGVAVAVGMPVRTFDFEAR